MKNVHSADVSKKQSLFRLEVPTDSTYVQKSFRDKKMAKMVVGEMA